MSSKGLLGQPVRPNSWRRSSYRSIRASTYWRPLSLLGLLLGWVLLCKHNIYYEALRAKYERTEFLDDADVTKQLVPSQMFLGPEDTHGDRLRLWQERANWRHLGNGYEGDVYLYNNSVIKTFNTKSSPLRNCVPGIAPGIRWPTEIQASLLLDGHVSSEKSVPVPDESDFVPIHDLFLSLEEDGTHGRWHMVSPFLESGDLGKLAKRLQPRALSYRELDMRFRPSFDRLLGALYTMHAKHNLCHDDIKSDNIFVTSFSTGAEDTHWLLGDLGNARQPTHAYHTSRLWSHDNDQIADCRANDAIRLVKTYTQFIQMASTGASEDSIQFDAAFFAQQEPWSRLYWSVNTAAAIAPMDAAAVLDESLRFPPEDFGEQAAYGFAVLESGEPAVSRPLRLSLRGAAYQELHRGLGLSERNARIHGVIGVPQSPC